MSPTIVFIAPAESRQICLYACVCVTLHACLSVCVCACMCGYLPDPKNAGIVHHIFGVCRETEAERDCRLHLLLSAAHPEAASERKLAGLGSKLHLVREENAAFVSFCMCRMCTVTVCIRECNDCLSHWGGGRMGSL